jgi:hypothetical protein
VTALAPIILPTLLFPDRTNFHRRLCKLARHWPVAAQRGFHPAHERKARGKALIPIVLRCRTSLFPTFD